MLATAMYTTQVVSTAVLRSHKLRRHPEVSNAAPAVAMEKVFSFAQSFLQPLSCKFAGVREMLVRRHLRGQYGNTFEVHGFINFARIGCLNLASCR